MSRQDDPLDEPVDAPVDERVEHYGFVYGEAHIPYRVRRVEPKPGKARKIKIQVPPDAQVVVNAPADAKKSDIHDAVMKRARWIFKHRESFRLQQEHVQSRRYVSGEMQFYLGRRYLLKINEERGAVNAVKLDRGKLLVTLQPADTDRAERVRILLRRWYRSRAEIVFKRRLDALLPLAPWVKDRPDYRILSMEKQWGSCSARGTLMLNPHLVKTARDCIDYVILHELCHIEEHNHGERFYRLLTQAMPYWKDVKQRLDGIAELVLNE